MKIDCHLHLPVRDDLKTLADKKRLLLEELNKNSIDYGIVIPDNLQESAIGNLSECLKLFSDESKIFLLATVNILYDPVSSIKEFEDLLKGREIVALKIFPGHDKHYPNDKRLEPFYELCIRYNTPFVIHTGWNSGNPEAGKWNDPKYIVKIAQRCNKLNIIIAHYFWPEVDYCYRITRGFNNIYFDTSGLADKEVVEATGKDKIKEILEKTIADNPRSVLLGSDYGACNIRDHIQLIESLDIKDEWKEGIFYKNAIEVFNLTKIGKY
jgi:predicted TIM-barrel fold metal-dependent hydrolase